METVSITGTTTDGSTEDIEVVIKHVDGHVSVNIRDTKFVIMNLSPLNSL
ncbi:MAG: hypothetical protein ACTSV2_06950 [Candidatus Thorarchaeota archaeon]